MPLSAVAGLNTFVFYFALPALLFRTMALRPFEELYHPPFLLAWLLAALITYGLVFILAKLFLRVSIGGAALYGLAAEFSNTGYLGLPLVINLLGSAAAVPLALAIIVDVSVMLSLTLVLAEFSTGGARQPLALLRTLVRGVLLNPLPLSIAFGMAASYTAWELPQPFEVFTRLLSGATGPAALFLIGAALALRPVSRGFGAVGLMVLGKLLLHPAAMLAVMVFVAEVPPYWVVAAVLNACIPTAANVFVLAERYGVQPERVSTAVFLSTLLAVATFTVAARLLGL